jgi:isocitrate dehydrogenase (NAD+)
MAHRVTIIPGDGIGPEVVTATRLVLDAAHEGIEWVEAVAGAGALESHGVREMVGEDAAGVLRT